MKILRKQKKNKSSITVRSVSILWLVFYLLNASNVNLNTNLFTLDDVIPLEAEFTGKYDYEVKNNKPCIIKYESLNQIGKHTCEVKFDDGISIKNTYGPNKSEYNFSNDLTISTKSDSAHIGVFKEYSDKPVTLSNIIKKVISKKDYSVYYVNTTYKHARRDILNTLPIVVFKNGKIKILNEKEFTENLANENDRALKSIKLAIMKNEIVNFFDRNMFVTAFKGLNRLSSEKEKLNTIIKDYINEDESPINIKNYRLEELNQNKDNSYECMEDATVEDEFDSALNEVIFLQGNKIDVSNDDYFLTNKNPEEIMETYKDEKAIKKGSSYYFKDMIFSYDKANPSQLMEVIVKSPKVYFDGIKLIGSHLNKLNNVRNCKPNNAYTVNLNGKLITIVEFSNNWSLIVDENSIIKSAIYRTVAYSFSNYDVGMYSNNPYTKIKLYDNEIKDFSLY